MKVAVIGDNCFDIYERLRCFYPTGNIVDTGVNLKKLGLDVSVITSTGSDALGQMMLRSLNNEALDTTHLKVIEGATAVTLMDLERNERIHGDYFEGVLADMIFDSKDIAFALNHCHVHSAFWGKAHHLMKEFHESGLSTSFDYADRLFDPIVTETESFVDYGFFSYPKGRDEVIKEYLVHRCKMGMKIAIATFGEGGSLAWDGSHFTEMSAVNTVVVNTIGAGDSFISGVLYGLLKHWPLEASLELGSKVAARVVSVFEPWPKGHHLDLIENRREL